MSETVKMAFKPEGVVISINHILPMKQVKPSVKKTKKYLQIASSINEIGIVEPLIVFPQNGNNGNFLLLDGHLRFEVLKDMKQEEVFCLLSTDDEAFTYNHKVNRISPIQEHFMILKAIKFGVTEEHIAKTLNVNVSKIRQNTNLLNGICPEAIELLKVKHITANALRILSKMKPIRQVEISELLIAANNYTLPYVKALYAATSQDQLCEREKPKKSDEFSVEDMALMEKEMKSVELDFKYYEESYGTNNLKIIQARGYISKLLKNGNIVRYLLNNYPETLNEFQKIIEVTSLED